MSLSKSNDTQFRIRIEDLEKRLRDTIRDTDATLADLHKRLSILEAEVFTLTRKPEQNKPEPNPWWPFWPNRK
jgi:hypothetical protein